MRKIRNKPSSYLVIIAVLAFSLATWYVFKLSAPKPTPVGINEVTATGTVGLEASPVPVSLYVGNSTTLDINATFDPNLTHLTAVTLDLSYLPDSLSITGFTSTAYLPVVLTPATYTNGNFNVTLGATPGSGGQPTWGTLGKLVFKALTPGIHVVNFTGNTLAAATESTGNVLKSVTPFTINVFNQGDANHDKKVDLFDYNILVSDYGRTDLSRADFNQSGKVDLFDYNLLVAHYGNVSQ